MIEPLWVKKAVALAEKNTTSRFVTLCGIFALCTFIYYVGELADRMGLESLQCQFFGGVHDVHRALFLIPLAYASRRFGTAGGLSIAAACFLVFLPRAIFVSPYPNPLLRASIFAAVAGLLSVFIARLADGRKVGTTIVAEAIPNAKTRAAASPPTRREAEVFVAGDLEVDVFSHEVRRRGQLINLTPTEFKLLAFLVYNRGRVITHLELLRRVWGPEYGRETEYLRVYINHLRHKIEDDPSRPKILLTQQGIGYRVADLNGDGKDSGITGYAGRRLNIPQMANPPTRA